jgi:exopolyphosphatase/guanosine-5'-triphosphate,3'-diphosphate pyrophosphatase
MKRVAVVDLGSNSTRLLVADVEDGGVREVVRRTRITRLGEGVDGRGRLLPLPITRVRNVLSDYRREAEQLGAAPTLALATSAVRDAENGEAFLGEIEWSYGFVTRLLSGHEEALLAFRGATVDRELKGETLLVDIGGGSMELVAGGAAGVDFHDSLDLGCVRLTERFLPSDPPTAGELEATAGAVRSLLAERVPDELRRRAREAIGVAGTITALAALDLELVEYDPARVHGHRLSRAAIERQLTRLAELPLRDRRAVPGLEPERAPVMVAGAVVLLETLAFFALDQIEASERDMLDGGALDAAELPERQEGPAPPGAYTCC